MEPVDFIEFRKKLSKYGNPPQGELEIKKDIYAFDRGLKSINNYGTVSLEEFKKQIDSL